MAPSELTRQFVHMLYGTLLIVLLSLFPENGTIVLGSILGLGIVLSIIEGQKHIPLISDILDILERSSNRSSFPGIGVITFTVGALMSWLLFDFHIALASIAILTVGDSINIIVGHIFGRRKHVWNDSKWVEGTIVGFIGAFIWACVFVDWQVALAGSVAGMLVEVPYLTVGRFKLDDNLLIPIVSGGIMCLVSYSF